MQKSGYTAARERLLLRKRGYRRAYPDGILYFGDGV